MTPPRVFVSHRLAAGLLAAGLVTLLAACSGTTPPPSSTSTAPTATVSATGTASPASSLTLSPTVSLAGPVDVERVLAHVKALAVDIGIRPSGSDAERRASQYIAGVLTSQGYATTVEPFTYTARFDDSTVTIPTATAIRAALLDGAALGKASGVLVDGGSGQPEQIAAVEAKGRVVLVRRGGLSFAQKVANAQMAGAVAVLVVNNEAGPFRGVLGPQRATIPALAINGNELTRLLATVGQTVSIEAAAGTRSVTSQNVVGRRGDACRVYISGHYDSVPQGPGANDNATGTASMLEIARVRGTDGLCAIAFGSEETGLNGSEAFVAAHPTGGVKFILNFDMMGRIDDAMIVGDGALTQSILGIIGRGVDQPLKAGTFPEFASSDHVSFTSVGLPAVTITSGDDPAIHSPRDTYEAVRKADLKTMVTLGDAALAGLLKTLGAR